MLDKLQGVEKRYLEIKEQMMQDDAMNDLQKSIALNRELSSLQEIYDLAQEYRKCENALQEAKEILNTETDPEMIDMAKQQQKEEETHKEELDQKVKIALLPKDPNDDKNIYLEIRPAAGGDEA